MEQLFLGGRMGLSTACSSGCDLLGWGRQLSHLLALQNTKTLRVKLSLSLWGWEMGETS